MAIYFFDEETKKNVEVLIKCQVSEDHVGIIRADKKPWSDDREVKEVPLIKLTVSSDTPKAIRDALIALKD